MTAHAGPVTAGAFAAEAEPYDFRGTSKFHRDQIRSLQVAHDVFTRRVASSLGNNLRAFVQVEAMHVDQVPFDDYVRSSPTPAVLGLVGCGPLPAPALVELDVAMALGMIDRLLGGTGRTDAVRRPTELETALLRAMLGEVATAMEATLAPFVDVAASLQAIEHNPQLVQVAAPTDLTVVLSFHVSIAHPVSSEGMLTLCYPVAALEPIIDQLGREHSAGEQAPDNPPLAPLLRTTALEMAMRVGGVAVPASEVASLAPGDVVALGVGPDEPATAFVQGRSVARGHPGRRGRRLALLITDAPAELRDGHPPPGGAQPTVSAGDITPWEPPSSRAREETAMSDEPASDAQPAHDAQPAGDAQPQVAAADFQELAASAPTGAPRGELDLLADVPLEVTVELGRVRLTVNDLLALQPGSVVELDRVAGAPVDVLVNGSRIARGEVVVLDEELGVRLTEILSNTPLGSSAR